MKELKSFDIYARISKEGERTVEEIEKQLAVYETSCREWAERNGIEIGEVVTETDVSGSVAVDERKLGALVRRVESKESAGILTPTLDRFGRGHIDGCLAYRRIKKAGGRLVCVQDGIDSDRDGDEFVFTIRMAVAEDYLRRVRANFQSRIERAASEGHYLACKPPVGYVRDHETGRITPHSKMRRLIADAFVRRAQGETAKSLASWLREVGGDIEIPNPKKPKNRKPTDPETVRPLASITEVGVRHMLANRAYLGEARVQSGTKGQPRTIQNAHEPLVTHEQWERAQAAGGPYRPNDGSLASQTRLPGLCRCPNGHRLKVGGRGKNGRTRAAYMCTHDNCDARVAIAADALDSFVAGVLSDAFLARDPHIVEIMEGSDRYERALDAVEAARSELATFETEVKVTDIGREAWLNGRAARAAAVELARDELKKIPAPTHLTPVFANTFEEALPTLERHHFARFIDHIVILPVGRGVRKPVGLRAHVYLVGSDEPVKWEPVQPLTHEDLAKLAFE